MEVSRQKPHAIMIPFPLQGHVIPFVNLAIKLASNGFTITFVNTESIHHQISNAKGNTGAGGNDIFIGARESGLDIRYATISDGLPLGFDRSLNHDQFLESFLHVLSAHVDEFVGNLVQKDPTVNTLIADTFHVWPSMIANKYNLVNVSFFTQPALVFTVYFHWKLLRENGHFASSDNRRDTIDYIPGVKSIMPSDLISYFQVTDNVNSPPHRIIDKCFEDVKKSDFIICNTVHEFEQETISAIQNKLSFCSFGPIFPPGFTKTSISTSLWSESDCTEWLNAKPHGSTLYVSFGSYAHASKYEITGVANGLLDSGVNFIWVLRPDIVSSGELDFLPDGFKDRVKDRGLIVSWCTQKEVLSHPAIGGFLTHCGWNSILEGIWCNLPLLCFPLFTDQFTNRKLVVEYLKIGINMVDNESLSSEEVSEKVNYAMKGKGADELREQVKKVRKLLEDAIATNGSSDKNFKEFIMGLNGKIGKKRGLDIKENGVVKENGTALNHLYV